MEKLGQSIEVIKSATGDMDKMLQIINQITLKSIVITDIVAKTELLAMNASIEAARAGDHGKGFSVVSEEVETLARTSGKSAKQIKDLLNESSIKVNQIIRTMNERIKEGEVVSKKAHDAFQRISEGVDQLKEQIQIISEGTDTILKVLNDTNQNKSLIESGNILIDKLIEINEKLIESSVDSQKAFSGQDGVTFMEKNKGNEVRRALKSMGF
jgi:methyl-accepting chemotaxis protein